jgi:hypothetical protein
MTENLGNAKKSEIKNETFKVSEEVKREITRYIEESYKSEVQEMIKSKKCWRRVGLSFETMAKITLALGGIFSFSSGYFDSMVLSFISGSICTSGLALLQFGAFGFKQGKKQASDLNTLLSKLELDTMPILGNEPDGLMNGNEKKIVDKGLNETIINIKPITMNGEETKKTLEEEIEEEIETNTFRKTKPKIVIINEQKPENN